MVGIKKGCAISWNHETKQWDTEEIMTAESFSLSKEKELSQMNTYRIILKTGKEYIVKASDNPDEIIDAETFIKQLLESTVSIYPLAKLDAGKNINSVIIVGSEVSSVEYLK